MHLGARMLASWSVVRVLRQRHLAVLWLSQFLSAVGDYLYEITVVWLSVQILGSEAGFVLSAGALSRLVFGMLAGVYADRWDRHKTMMAVDSLRGLTVLSLPLASFMGHISVWHLTIVGAVLGGLSALFEPALQASLPVVAGDVQTLQAMNGLMDVTRRLARIFGPMFAGLVGALVPMPQLFTVDAASFGISVGALFVLRRAFARLRIGNRARTRGIGGIVADIVGAARLVHGHRPLLWSLVGGSLIALAWSAAFSVGVALYATEALEASVGAYGLILGAYGAGNVVSNLVVSSLTVKRRALSFFVGKIVLGTGFLLLAYAPNLMVALMSAALAAVGGPMGDVPILTTIQSDFPTDQIGKVYSLRMTVSSIGFWLGLMLAAPLFRSLSPSNGIAVCALIMVTVGVLGAVRFHGQERS